MKFEKNEIKLLSKYIEYQMFDQQPYNFDKFQFQQSKATNGIVKEENKY
jgi:hypothetical protein